MRVTNVGWWERVLRFGLGVVVLVASTVLLVARPTFVTAGVALVGGVAAGLLFRSVKTAYCPIHERTGTDTTRD